MGRIVRRIAVMAFILAVDDDSRGSSTEARVVNKRGRMLANLNGEVFLFEGSPEGGRRDLNK
jgi:hypothetical protein